MATLTEVFPCFFLSCKANARVKPANTGHDPHSSLFLYCYMYCFFCVVLCVWGIVLVPPVGYPIAVHKYIIISSFLNQLLSIKEVMLKTDTKYIKKHSCGKSHGMKIISASIFLNILLILSCLLQGRGAAKLGSQYTAPNHSDRHTTDIFSLKPANSQQLNATCMT
jgi:hypothetical protein